MADEITLKAGKGWRNPKPIKNEEKKKKFPAALFRYEDKDKKWL